MIFNEVQQELAEKIETTNKLTDWKNWKWQLKHAIKSLEQFERLTGIRFDEKERTDLELSLDEVDEADSIGIEKLLTGSDTISLVPENNERIQRREDHAG
jgi:hypothetical protein